jgi:hypothetical protein
MMNFYAELYHLLRHGKFAMGEAAALQLMKLSTETLGFLR